MTDFVVYNMDVLEGLKRIASESVDCVFTSPPYWGLRDYLTGKWEGGDSACNHLPPNQVGKNAQVSQTIEGIGRQPYKDLCGKCGARRVDKQIGLETTFKEYVADLLNVFDEVKRVLKPTGTCFVNLGDTYYGGGGGNQYSPENKGFQSKAFKNNPELEKSAGIGYSFRKNKEMLDKSLCNIPYRFSIGMQDRGWILRNILIWHKPSCMPSSVKDRFTVDFEPVFFFVKQKKYFFEQQLEPVKEESLVRAQYGELTSEGSPYAKQTSCDVMGERFVNPAGRNMRTVWSINSEPYREAHFAVFPSELVRRGLKAGCPTQICIKCGKPREAIREPTEEYAKILKHNKENGLNSKDWFSRKEQNFSDGRKSGEEIRTTAEYKIKGYSNCGCGVGFMGGVVLDPFVGSGTTLFVAQEIGLNGIGIDLNDKYLPLMKKRLLGDEKQASLNPNKFTVIK